MSRSSRDQAVANPCLRQVKGPDLASIHNKRPRPEGVVVYILDFKLECKANQNSRTLPKDLVQITAGGERLPLFQWRLAIMLTEALSLDDAQPEQLSQQFQILLPA